MEDKKLYISTYDEIRLHAKYGACKYNFFDIMDNVEYKDGHVWLFGRETNLTKKIEKEAYLVLVTCSPNTYKRYGKYNSVCLGRLHTYIEVHLWMDEHIQGYIYQSGNDYMDDDKANDLAMNRIKKVFPSFNPCTKDDNKEVFEKIIELGQTSKYKNCSDFDLYNKLTLAPYTIDQAIKNLEKANFIELKEIKTKKCTFHSIKATSKGIEYLNGLAK